MATNISKADGTPISLADDTVDSTSTSLELPGRNVSNYGQYINQDLVRILEHYSRSTAPSNPTKGQVWHDTSIDKMKYYNGTDWLEFFSADSSGNFVPPVDCGPPGTDLGAPGLRFCNVYAVDFWGDTFHGIATEAQYADLAERFATDKPYIAGTLVSIGGEKEITETTEKLDVNVLGVISDEPGLLMNSEAGSFETHPPVAYKGRLNVRVVGEIYKGERLVSSGVPGVAMRLENDALDKVLPQTIVGRALEDKNTKNEGLVLSVVGVK